MPVNSTPSLSSDGLVHFTLNGLNVKVEPGTTLLGAAQFFGIPIPTLCYQEGLTPYGACRLCIVEIGEGPKARLVSSCTYPVEEGLNVRTASSRVIRARRMILELLLASCPQSKKIQDLASSYGIRQQRFKQEYEDCILCGLCVRICEQQMKAKAIGFRGRGEKRSIGTPFDIQSEDCRLCGACMYVCPACQLRCTYHIPEKVICGGCENLSPPCLKKEEFHDLMCFMDPCVACEIKKD
jgi:bidirectional [NiFe] hydrogenase diaphorase subunit